MTAAHTPGPWEVFGMGLIMARKPGTSEHLRVRSDWEHAPGTEIAERHANARLIASAPDLLAALKMLREIDDAYGFDLNEQQRDQMHDALAKAEVQS